MADFSRYPCWDPAVAAATLNTEAVSPSPSVFFATHAPLRIYRSLADGRRSETQGHPVDEEEVRRDFLSRSTAAGILLMPVIGQSGSGKSHLVRWVKENTPTTDSRHVIYLPKTQTSLKAVVKTLLTDVEDGELDQLKADVDRMSSDLDQAGLERRLLNYLHEALAASAPVSGSARALTGPGGLAVLLLDPHVRDYLLRPDCLIPRLAASLLADRHEGDPDRPLSFTTNDLPLDILDVKKASEVAQKRLMLIKGRAELQDAAVAMLNEQLPLAVTNAANIGVGRLQGALLDIRREFARRGKEIVLLIEDFAVIQGIQRDLLDAIIEVGERDGRTILAPVRTLMAVTTGYYGRLADTVLTRARAATPYVYDLDVQFDPNDEGMAQVTSFVGRYLNAARLGRDELDAARIRSADNIPNACDNCDFRHECHAAFDSSSDGHGLYPFNRVALRRAIHARPPDDSPTAFNPRAVIGEVVRNVLVEHAEALAEGTFPDPRFRAEYPTLETEQPLPSTVRDRLDDLDPNDAARRATFLEFWGDSPAQPVNLLPGLHRAFDISLLENLEEGPPSPPIPNPKPTLGGNGSASDLPKSIQKMIQDVENWYGRSQVMHPDTAGKLRGIIRDAVIQRCGWNDPLMQEPNAEVLKRAWPSKSVVVSIEGAATENLPGTADAPIKFSRTPANSVFFQGLLKASMGKPDGVAEHIRRLYAIADSSQRSLIREVIRVQSTADQQLVTALRASLIGAALAGQAWPGMDQTAMLNTVLDDGRTWARADAATRTPEWLRTLERHREVRRDLVANLRSGFGVSRGVTGGVRIIDAARAMPLLRSAAESWEWQTPSSELPSWVRNAVNRFTEWGNLVETQITLLGSQLGRLRSYLPKGTRPDESIDAIRKALAAATKAGHAPDDVEQVEATINNAAALDWRTVDLLENDLNAASASGGPDSRSAAKIIAAVRDRGADLAVIGDFLASSDRWLSEALHDAAMREGGATTAAASQVQDLIRQWAEFGSGSQA